VIGLFSSERSSRISFADTIAAIQEQGGSSISPPVRLDASIPEPATCAGTWPTSRLRGLQRAPALRRANDEAASLRAQARPARRRRLRCAHVLRASARARCGCAFATPRVPVSLTSRGRAAPEIPRLPPEPEVMAQVKKRSARREGPRAAVTATVTTGRSSTRSEEGDHRDQSPPTRSCRRPRARPVLPSGHPLASIFLLKPRRPRRSGGTPSRPRRARADQVAALSASTRSSLRHELPQFAGADEDE
jgi:hypothetical protein